VDPDGQVLVPVLVGIIVVAGVVIYVDSCNRGESAIESMSNALTGPASAVPGSEIPSAAMAAPDIATIYWHAVEREEILMGNWNLYNHRHGYTDPDRYPMMPPPKPGPEVPLLEPPPGVTFMPLF
jgi:hypothetical protein